MKRAIRNRAIRAGMLFVVFVPGAAMAVENPARALCDFVKSVAAAKPNDFSTLKGTALNPALFHNEAFQGTLLPMSGAECTLNIKRRVGSHDIPANYSCALMTSREAAEANRIFARTALELRACFPGAKFEVAYNGEAKNPQDDFDWTVTTAQPGYEIEVEMSNSVDLIAQTLTGATGNPKIEVSLKITDTADAPI